MVIIIYSKAISAVSVINMWPLYIDIDDRGEIGEASLANLPVDNTYSNGPRDASLCTEQRGPSSIISGAAIPKRNRECVLGGHDNLSDLDKTIGSENVCNKTRIPVSISSSDCDTDTTLDRGTCERHVREA